MRLHRDTFSKAPIYAQIVEQVKDLVATGALRPGDQLPTVREMAAELGVNFNTVARAYRLLHEERVISTQQGRGTYVQGPSPSTVEESAQQRMDRLAGLVDTWLSEADRCGFRPAEVEKAWTERFIAWSGRKPDGTHA